MKKLAILGLMLLVALTAISVVSATDDRFGTFDNGLCVAPEPVLAKSSSGSSDSDGWCAPKWECSEWSACTSRGIQTRTCEDKWSCGSLKGLPELYQSCDYSKDSEEQVQQEFVEPELFNVEDTLVIPVGVEDEPQIEGQNNEITGAVTGSASSPNAVLFYVLAALIAGMLLLFLVFRLRK